MFFNNKGGLDDMIKQITNKILILLSSNFSIK